MKILLFDKVAFDAGIDPDTIDGRLKMKTVKGRIPWKRLRGGD